MVSRARKIAVGAVVPISHALMGLAGGFGAVAIVQPTQEFRAGPIVLQQTVEVGSVSTFSGEELFHAPPFKVDVDLKIIDKADTPKAIQDIKEIYTSEDGTPTSEDVQASINSKFKDPFENQLRKLAIQTALVFAGGAALAMRTKKQIWELVKRGAFHTANAGIHTYNWIARKINGDQNVIKLCNEIEIPSLNGEKLKYRGFFAGVGRDLALGLAMSGMVLFASGVQINLEEVKPRVEEIASQPVQEYLLTGTSKMVPNFKSINDALALQLDRFTGIGTAIENGSQALIVPPSDVIESKTYLIVSDPHNLPTAPQLIEAVARAGAVDGIIILGDFLNTGAQFELDSLAGYSIGETNFQGFDDIKTCVAYIADGCKEEGDPFEIFALSANHDTRTLMDALAELGIRSLEADPPDFLKGQIAMNDACFVEETTCQGGIYKEVNAQAGAEVRDSIDFSDDNINKPTVGFFASDSAAREFQGSLETIIFGGGHRFSYGDENGTEAIEVGAVGAGFPRVAEYSNVVIATFDRRPNGIDLSGCLQAQWDPFEATAGLTELTACDK